MDDVALNVSVNSTSSPSVSVNSAFAPFTYQVGSGPSASQSFTVSGSNLTAGATVTAPTNYEVSSDNSTFGTSVNLPQSGGSLTGQPVTLYVRLKGGLAIGTYNESLTTTSTGATDVVTNLTGSVTSVPTLTTSSSLTPFSSVQGTPSAAQTFTVSGSSLTANAVVTAPTDYEVSTNGTTFFATVNLVPTGGAITNATVHVRLKATAAVGSPAGNVTIASTGATTQNVAVSGTVAAGPSISANPTTLSGFSTTQGTASANQTTSVSGSNLTADITATAPTGYEVSLDGSTYSNAVTLTQTGGTVAATTVYVRIKSNTAAGSPAGNLVLASTGAVSVNVALSGTVNVAPAQPFTLGSLVVYRVGDGSAALNSNATAAFLEEVTVTGNPVQTIALPTAVIGSNKRMTAGGTATTEGMINRSTNKQYLLIGGYDTDLGTSAVTGTTAASVNRVVGRMNYSATLDATTALTDVASGQSIRSIGSVDGSAYWITSANGVNYATHGASTSTSLASTNTRTVGIAAGQLYATSASGSNRLVTVGTGLPTTAGQTVTNLPGFPTGGSPNGFFFADLSPSEPGVDVVYVADDASGIGLQKFSLVGGTWIANGNIAVTGNGLRGLTGSVSGTTVTLYGTSPTTLFSLVDNSGYNATITGTPTTLATAAPNTAFRGIAWAPENIAAGPLPVTFTNIRAAQQGTGIKVSFTNQTETDVVRYEIERSGTGRSFVKVAELAPARNNGARADYAITDASPLSGENIYRVKSTETNGKITYSAIARVNTRNGNAALQLYPNPVKGADLSVQLSSLPAGKYSLRLVNAAGQVLQTRPINHNGGSLSESLGVSGLASGLYSVQVDGPVQLQKTFLVQQ